MGNEQLQSAVSLAAEGEAATPPPMTNEELASRIQTGQRELMPQLWEQVRGFIARMAIRRYILTDGFGGVEIDDLVQAGFLGLCEAVERFDEAQGYKLLTYLRPCLTSAFYEAEGRTHERTARDPIHRALSLDAPIGEDDDGTLGDLVHDPADAFEDADARIWREQLHEALENALAELPAAEASTLRGRYYRGMTMREIGESGGVSVDTVRKRERDGLRSLRRRQSRWSLEEFLGERRKYVEAYTPWWMSVGVDSFNRTHSSAPEEIVMIRERLREGFERGDLKGRDYD